MGEWHETTLETLVKFGNGKARPKTEGDIPVYGGNGILGYSSESNYDFETIVIGRVGAYCGATYYANKPIWISDNALSAKPKNGNDARYLYYLLKGLDLNHHAQGSSHPLLTHTLLNGLEIRATLNEVEQKAIAEVLSSLDDKIDLLHRQNQTLESLAETLFRHTFIDNAQDDWEERSVRDIADYIKKSRSPSKEPEEVFYHYSIPSFDAGHRPSVEAGKEIRSNKYSVLPKSILVSKLNPRFPRVWPIGNSIYKNAVCSTEFQVFQPKVKEQYGFLYYLFKSDSAKDALIMASSGTSGSHQRARPEDMLDIRFKTSGEELIEMYSKHVAPMIDKTLHNIEQIQTLENLRDTLLPKLMSGDVRVKYDDNSETEVM